MTDELTDAATATHTQAVERPQRFAAESTSTQATAAGGAGANAALSGLVKARVLEDPETTSPHVPAERPVARAPERPPPPPLQAVLESRVIATAKAAPPPEPQLSVDFAPWAMNATVNPATSAGVFAARPVVPPPSFLVAIDPALADEIKKVIAALTGQSKKNFTMGSLIGDVSPESILATLSVRRVTTANVAFSKRAQQLTSSGNEPALCLLRLEREERLLEARVVIRQSRPGATLQTATMELTATAPTAIAEDIAAFEELRRAIATRWGVPVAPPKPVTPPKPPIRPRARFWP